MTYDEMIEATLAEQLEAVGSVDEVLTEEFGPDYNDFPSFDEMNE